MAPAIPSPALAIALARPEITASAAA